MKRHIQLSLMGFFLLGIAIGFLWLTGRRQAGTGSPLHPPKDQPLLAQTKPTTRPNPPTCKLDLASAFIEIDRKQLYQYIEDQGIKLRDEQTSALADAIGLMPPGQSVKSLVVDTFLIKPNGISLMWSQLFLHNENADKETPGKIESLNPIKLNSKDWSSIEPWVEDVVSGNIPDTRRQPVFTLAIISYFNGTTWRKSIWVNPNYEKNVTASFVNLMTALYALHGKILDIFELDQITFDRFQPVIEPTDAATRPATARVRTGLRELTLDLGNRVTMTLVQIPAGKFLMGSPETEKDHYKDEGLHEVAISKPFYMGVYEVTVDQFAEFVKESGIEHINPRFAHGDHPVVNVAWEEAQAFCKWLSGKTGKAVSLPTEAQWEYACRAGSKTRFSFGDPNGDLYKFANYCDKSNTSGMSWRDKDRNDGFDRTAPIGLFQPNAWGLYDMHGNAWEWCLDWYGQYPTWPVNDPTGPVTGSFRVSRGGSWLMFPALCRSAHRDRLDPGNRSDDVGFRVVVSPEADK